MLLNVSVLGEVSVELVVVVYKVVVVETSVVQVDVPTNIHDKEHPLPYHTGAVRCYGSGFLASDTNFYCLCFLCWLDFYTLGCG